LEYAISHTASQLLRRYYDTEQLDVSAKRAKRRFLRTLTSRRFVRYGLLGANLLVLAIVFIYVSDNNSQAMQSTATIEQAQGSTGAIPLDQLSAADIAVNIAEAANLPETTAVINQADSANADLSIASVASTIVSEPQEVATAFKSRFDIQTYTVQAGDTVSSIAAKFNVTSNSISWSNGLSGNTVAAGTKLLIPPVNGIVYNVKPGDTIQSLAQKYNASQALIVADNDAEISGIWTGEQIIIPNGQQPEVSSAADLLGIGGSLSASYAGFGECSYAGKTYSNYGYDCGYCTWWTAMKRATSGDPVPSNLGEAYSWRYTAAAMGIPEGNKPEAGAVIWFPDDHVAYVESVAGDGSVTISEMNHVSWGVMDYRTFPASVADSYTYIY
jgi:surface antigen